MQTTIIAFMHAFLDSCTYYQNVNRIQIQKHKPLPNSHSIYHFPIIIPYTLPLPFPSFTFTLPHYSFLIFQFQNSYRMFQSFLTAINSNQPSRRHKKDLPLPSSDKQTKLREGIREMVVSMMPYRELCVQAAMNIGLPASVLDFQKVLKLASSEGNLSSLNFTSMQLTTLQKQCAKLKKTITFATPIKDHSRPDNRTNTRKETTASVGEVQTKKESPSRLKLRRAMEEELAFRIKVKNMNSREQLEKKEEILKKRMEKAKSMNKRALKVYKNYKQKQEQSYDFFKVQTIKTLQSANPLEVPPKILEEKFLTTSKQSFRQGKSSRENSCDLLKVSIHHTSYLLPSEKSKTAGTRLRIRYNQPTLESSITAKTTLDRFAEYKKRETMTRSKKEEMERSREEQALYRLIKKNERLNELQQQHEKQQEKHTKRIQKLQQESLSKQPPNQLLQDFDNGIKEKCEDRQLRKEMQLQEQVNRIRQELQMKQQRRDRHRLRREREHDQNMTLNEQYLRDYMERCQTVKQKDHRHEMTIKRRHRMLREKENDERIMKNLSKFTDQELLKSMERLNTADHNSIFQ